MQELAYNLYQSRIKALVADVSRTLGDPAIGDNLGESSRLNVVFAGQYSAGKSSLIKMLTGQTDIRIGAGVTTDFAAAYDYKSIRVWDTPGILAGQREQHDAESMAAIAGADLIVYVITNELFDDVVGAAFRKLCFEQGRAKQIMLVVNKAQNDAADRATKLAAMAQVLDPLLPEDFSVVFTDAQSYFDALEEDDEVEKSDLLALSGHREFVEAIDAFVASRALYGRLTRPLSEVQAAIEQRLSQLTISDPVDEGLETVLQQIKREYRAGHSKLAGQIDAALERMAASITEEGNALADALGVDEERFKDQQEEASRNTALHCDTVRKEVEACVTTACEDLESVLERIKSSSLANKVKLALNERVEAANLEAVAAGPDAAGFVDAPTKLNTAASRAAIESGQKGLSWLASSAVGDAAKTGLGRVSGSTLHTVVKEVGGFFNYSFESWGAIKIAERIGSGARFLGPALAVLGLGMQAYDDYKQAEHARKVLETKREIRGAFRSYGTDLRLRFSEQLKVLLRTVFDKPVAEIDACLDQLRGNGERVSSEIQALKDQLSQARALRDELSDLA